MPGVGGINPGWQPTQNTIWLMQSIGLSLSLVNAGLSGIMHSAMATLLIQAAIAGYLAYVQHLGNQSVSASTAQALDLAKDLQTKAVADAQAQGGGKP